MSTALSVKAVNLSTLEEAHYTSEEMTPRQAVINAYAQFTKRDFNTWQYQERYAHLVQEGQKAVSIGDWCALTDRSFL